MSEFGYQLKKMLEESEISINSFAKTIQIDRSYLYRIFSGAKAISPEKLQTILTCDLFTKSQCDQLRTAFYTEKYGAEQYARISAILQGLEELRAGESPSEPFAATDHAGEDETSTYTSRRSLSSAIAQKLSDACKTGEDYLYTNFSSSQAEIDKAIYALLRRLPEPVAFTYLTTLDTTGKTTHNIRTIFSALKYISLGYGVLCRYRNAYGRGYPGTLYPYFIYCRTGLMLFDAPAEHGVWIPAKYLNDSVEQSIQKLAEDYSPMAMFTRSIFELKNYIANFSQLENTTQSLSYTPCIGPYLTEEMYRDIINPDIPNVEYIIASTLGHYQTANNNRTMFTIEGLREFVQTGEINEFPQALMRKPLSPAHRVEILQQMINRFRRNNQNLLLLDSGKIRFPQGYNIEFYVQDQLKVIFAATTQRMDANDYLYNTLIPIEDPILTTDLMAVYEYLIDNHMIYSAHYTEHLLGDLLTLAKSLC